MRRLANLVASSSSARVAAASLVARLSLLATLLVGAVALTKPEFSRLAYLVGTASAVQVLLDPSTTANFVVTRWTRERPQLGVATFLAGLKLQAVACGIVLVGPVAVALATHLGGDWPLIGLALGALAAGESLSRYVRTRWQVGREFTRYAWVDIRLSAVRVATCIVLGVTGSPQAFAAACAVAAAVNLTFAWAGARDLHAAEDGISLRSVLADSWPFNASTFFSAIYAQGPTVLLGLAGSIRSAAVYSIVTRLTQPTELLPAALSSVKLPDFVAARGDELRELVRSQVKLAGGLGALVALTLMALGIPLLAAFKVGIGEGYPVLLLLAATLPMKFVSYQLVAVAIARGQIRSRLVAAAVVAAISVTGVLLAAPHGADYVAAVSLSCEAILLVVLLRLTNRSRMELTLAEAS